MKPFLIYSFLLFTFFSVEAQFEEKGDRRDTLKTSYLEEVVVSAGKASEMRRYVAQQIKIISPSTILNLNAQSSADLLANTGVVAMQKSQQGGGSPILRGFEASRVLLVVDGIRMNNLIYRAGHLQNVITVDQNMLERAEVLFGPASTAYGSDALGGAVYFFTRNPKLASAEVKSFSGSSFLRMGSVNKEKTFHSDFNVAGKKTASLTSLTYSDFDDLRMGEKINPALGSDFGLRPSYVKRSVDNQSDQLIQNNDPYVQRNSGYKQLDVLQKILFKPSEKTSHLINFQISNSTEIPRYDRLTDPTVDGLKFAEWYYGPQKRLLTSYRFEQSLDKNYADKISVLTSYQQIEESRYQRRFNNTGLQQRIESVDVAALTIDLEKKTDKNDIRYGLDVQLNGAESKASKKDILTGILSPLDTRYPGGKNQMHFASVYLTHTLKISPRITLNDGLRMGISSLYAQFIDQTFFPFPFNDVRQNNFISSATAGIIFTPDQWKVSLLGGTGFRAPNIDDLAKVFESVAGDAETQGTLIVPNPDLKPEKTINADFSVMRLIGEVGRIEGTAFVTSFYDAIVTLPFELNGASVIEYDGAQAKVYANQNRNRALIYGSTLQFKMDLNSNWDISGSWNYTKGKVRSSDVPLDHIPPTFGRISVQYHGKNLRGEFFSNFNGWKRIKDYSSSGEDNQQYAPTDGMPSWYTLNLRFSTDVSKRFTVQAGVDNLLDLQYRTFASGINSPGRNIFLTLRVRY